MDSIFWVEETSMKLAARRAGLYGVTSQKIELFIVTTVRTPKSNIYEVYEKSAVVTAV
jgi:hypothetical protein